MNEDYYMERIGIIDEVSAKRRKEEVVSLRGKVRFDTDLSSTNSWSDEKQVDEAYISFPPGSPVNPGDLVHMSVRVTPPFGKRFRPALETSVSEADFQTDADGELIIDPNLWTTYPDSKPSFVSKLEDDDNQNTVMLNGSTISAVCSTFQCDNWAIEQHPSDTGPIYGCRIHPVIDEDADDA